MSQQGAELAGVPPSAVAVCKGITVHVDWQLEDFHVTAPHDHCHTCLETQLARLEAMGLFVLEDLLDDELVGDDAIRVYLYRKD